MALKKKHSGRKLRNFLLNKKLQLSFALFILGVTAALTLILVSVIYYEVNKATEMFVRQRREATKMFVRQRKEATKMFSRQREMATKIMQQQLKVATDMLKVMEQDEELKVAVQAARADLKKRDAERLAMRRQQDKELRERRQKQDEELQERREKQDREIAEEQREGMYVLVGAMVGFSLIFLVALFLYGIVLTHKVAGPLFKITRHMDEVKEGKLKEIWGLRKGDQLVEFFEHFKQMHDALKERTAEDIQVLQAAKEELADAQGEGVEEAIKDIDMMIQKKKDSLEAKS
jgi:hypothetical protein